MIQDDKIILSYGLLCVTDDAEFMSFDGKKFTLNEAALKAHLKAVSNAGVNAVRIMPWCVWGKRPRGKLSQFQPYFLDTSRDKWDLSLFAGPYFRIMRRIFEIANGAGLTVIFCWFDNCQMQGGYRKWSPWYSNTQGITSFYGSDADKYTKRWISGCLNQFSKYNVLWAFGNELNNAAFPAMAQRVIFPIIRARKLDFNRMTYGATMEDRNYMGQHQYCDSPETIQDTVKKFVEFEFGEHVKLDIYKEVHACGYPVPGDTVNRPYGCRVDQALCWWGKRPIRILFSDDGRGPKLNGDSKCDRDISGKSRPSADKWYKMMTYILGNYPNKIGAQDKLLNFEHVPGGGDLACQTATIESMSKAYKAKFGKWPHNHKG